MTNKPGLKYRDTWKDKFVRSLSRGSKKGVFLVLKLRVSISSKVDHDSLVSSKMEKP